MESNMSPRAAAVSLLMAALVVAPIVLAPAAQAGPEKVGPLLRTYTHPHLNLPVDPQRMQAEEGVTAAAAASRGVRCLIHGDVSRAALEALGVTVTTDTGPVKSAFVPPHAVSAVAALGGVVRVQAARRYETYLETAAVEVLVRPGVHGGNAPPYTGNTGTGVLIGLVDSGVDFLHDDFRTDTDLSRFEAIWDQNYFGTPPAGFTVGHEWTKQSLDNRSAAHDDAIGHGTHVAGILGGNGRATGNGQPQYTHVGVAPGAKLLAVASSFNEADILDGIDYIFQKADALGVPGVANLSLGFQGGPHDGTDAMDLAVDALSGPGHIVVCSAGNARGTGTHAQGSTGPGDDYVDFVFNVTAYTPAPSFADDIVFFNFWYEGDENYTLEVFAPNGTSSGMVTKGGIGFPIIPGMGMLQIDHGTTAPGNGDVELFVALLDPFPGTPTPALGDWTFRLHKVSSSGQTIHCWASLATIPGTFTTNATDDVTIAIPASAGEAVTVAAYTTTVAWTAINGAGYSYISANPLGDIATFSSRGPLRNGLPKPDIAAPGMGLFSALSADFDTAGATPRVGEDGVHWIIEGTSMSAPMVSGIIGLMMDKDGPMTPAQVKTRLAETARTDAFTGAVPNADWGAGKVSGVVGDPMPPLVTLSTPNGGETFFNGEVLQIEWNASDNVGLDHVNLHYSDNGGASFPHEIGLGLPPTGSHVWQAPTTPGSDYRVRVTAVDGGGNESADEGDGSFTVTATTTDAGDPRLPVVLSLAQNLPNPMVSATGTRIGFALPGNGPVRLHVLDAAGRRVRTLVSGDMPAGDHRVQWDGRTTQGTEVASGVYFYRLEAGGKTLTRKLMVAR